MSYRQKLKKKHPAKYAKYLEEQKVRSKERRMKLKEMKAQGNDMPGCMKALLEKESDKQRQQKFREKNVKKNLPKKPLLKK